MPCHCPYLQELPEDNRRVLDFVVALMNDVALRADENKMTRNNLAIVFGPNLAWPREDEVWRCPQIDMANAASLGIRPPALGDGSCCPP